MSFGNPIRTVERQGDFGRLGDRAEQNLTFDGGHMAGALDNLRVLDFSRILAGPLATMQLADLGATVTKVERPGTGDDTRAWGPPYDDRGNATYFQAVNRNKDAIVLQKVGVAMVDVLAGLFATVGILAALHHRASTGEGQRVDIDLLSCLLAGLANQASAYTSGGVVPTRMGNRHPSIAPYEALPCADGDLVLAVGNDRQFAALCNVLGAPELATDERFATNPARVRHREQLHAELTSLLARRTVADWAQILTNARVPAGVVNDIAGAFALATNLGLEPIVALPRDDGSTVSLCRNPINLSATPPPTGRRHHRWPQHDSLPDRLEYGRGQHVLWLLISLPPRGMLGIAARYARSNATAA